jgi:signal peptidase
VLNWLGILMLIAVVVPFVVFAVPGVAGAGESYVVLSGSMEPTISTGDVVLVDDVDPADVEERDVITYLRDGADTPTTHRVVGINEEEGELSFVTKGDANEDPDAAPVAASEVMGRVVFTIPYIGYVIEFVNTPAGFISLVIVPFVLLLLSEMYSILGGGSGSKDGESDETPADTADPDPGRAGSASEMGPSEMKDVTTGDSDDAGTEPVVRRPVHGPAPTETNGQRAASKTAPEAKKSEDGIAVTRSDLRLSLGVLTGTAVYAGWVVYNIQTAWSFAVAFGSGIGTVLVGSMYYAAGGDDVTEAETASDTGSVRASDPVAVTGSAPAVRTDGLSVLSPERAGTEGRDQAEPEEEDE